MDFDLVELVNASFTGLLAIVGVVLGGFISSKITKEQQARAETREQENILTKAMEGARALFHSLKDALQELGAWDGPAVMYHPPTTDLDKVRVVEHLGRLLSRYEDWALINHSYLEVTATDARHAAEVLTEQLREIIHSIEHQHTGESTAHQVNKAYHAADYLFRVAVKAQFSEGTTEKYSKAMAKVGASLKPDRSKLMDAIQKDEDRQQLDIEAIKAHEARELQIDEGLEEAAGPTGEAGSRDTAEESPDIADATGDGDKG